VLYLIGHFLHAHNKKRVLHLGFLFWVFSRLLAFAAEEVEPTVDLAAGMTLTSTWLVSAYFYLVPTHFLAHYINVKLVK